MFEGRDVAAELKETWRITRLSAWRAVIEFYEADNLTYAASVAYYALLSLFPFALITVSILGSVTADDQTRQRVLLFALRYFPGQFDFIITQLDAFPPDAHPPRHRRRHPAGLGCAWCVRCHQHGRESRMGCGKNAQLLEPQDVLVPHAPDRRSHADDWIAGRHGGANYRRPLVCGRLGELSSAPGHAGLHDPQRCCCCSLRSCSG